jgi:hypothetical protein
MKITEIQYRPTKKEVKKERNKENKTKEIKMYN